MYRRCVFQVKEMLCRLGRNKLIHAEDLSVWARRCSGTVGVCRCIVISSVGSTVIFPCPNRRASCWSAKRGKRYTNQRSCLDKWQGLSWEVDWFANPIHAQTEEPGVGAPKEEKETQIKGEQMWTCWIIGLVGGLD